MTSATRPSPRSSSKSFSRSRVTLMAPILPEIGATVEQADVYRACSFSTTISPRSNTFEKPWQVIFQRARVDAEAAGIAATERRMM